ncbi:MAG: hypothetical protein QOJ74_2264, partial [Ilumatobacteraceae bacterium]|nr:hypothetical protein [Ilumatobacteraceae bacterium]
HKPSSARQPGRQRRWIAGIALAAIVAVIALAQLGGVDGTGLDQQATPSTVPPTTAVPATTVAPTVSTTAPPTVILNAPAPKPKAGGHGKDHKQKG